MERWERRGVTHHSNDGVHDPAALVCMDQLRQRHVPSHDQRVLLPRMVHPQHLHASMHAAGAGVSAVLGWAALGGITRLAPACVYASCLPLLSLPLLAIALDLPTLAPFLNSPTWLLSHPHRLSFHVRRAVGAHVPLELLIIDLSIPVQVHLPHGLLQVGLAAQQQGWGTMGMKALGQGTLLELRCAARTRAQEQADTRFVSPPCPLSFPASPAGAKVVWLPAADAH